MFSPFTMQKVNILVYGLNKLGMKNFVEFLYSGFAEDTFDLPIEQKREYMDIVSDVKYIHGRKYVYQKEKCIYMWCPKMGGHIS